MDVLLERALALWRTVWQKKGHMRSLRTYLDRRDHRPEPIVDLLHEYAVMYCER